MQYITTVDFLLLPLYLFFLYFIIKITARKYNGTPLKKYFVLAFFLHMGGCFLYAMMIQFYYGYGDSFGFYKGSNFIRDYISNGGNPFQIFYISSEELVKPQSMILNSGLELPIGIGTDSNFVVMKISALISYFTFNSYLIISLFFGLFSFAGLWKLFSTFNAVLEKKAEKLLAYTILYTPSICFWGSGLMKDSICLGLTGFIVYFLHKMFIIKKMNIRDMVLMVAFFYLLFVLKSYIASTLIVSVSLTYVILVLKKSRQNVIKLLTVSLIIVVSAVFLIVSLSSTINSIVDESKSQIEIFKGAYASADEDVNSLAGFKPGDFDVSIASFILRSPIAMFSTLFRPFLWESKKLVMLFSAIESFLMLLALLYVLFKCRVLKFFYVVFAEPYVFFAFIFTLLLSAIVGFTTFNFGTLVRYRLPVLPFYFFMLIAVYTKTITARVALKKTE
ncbi:MAG: hypothetical protein ABI685_00300 [Ferruginibacter sp.]